MAFLHALGPAAVFQPGLTIDSPHPAPIEDKCSFCQTFLDPLKCCHEVHAGREPESPESVFGAFHGTLVGSVQRIPHSYLAHTIAHHILNYYSWFYRLSTAYPGCGDLDPF